MFLLYETKIQADWVCSMSLLDWGQQEVSNSTSVFELFLEILLVHEMPSYAKQCTTELCLSDHSRESTQKLTTITMTTYHSPACLQQRWRNPDHKCLTPLLRVSASFWVCSEVISESLVPDYK